ncbi:LamG-like jellyroll fold domain-containing protein [Flavobacterium algicola]|uniref:LamG-like jellyroll fold domain-containing protein n=1 Tax=Flavobacterium algicola TaxID=556529 RepID=UPI001EFD4547|nr:LamG-like jellyroll fold domain-containing protein [Flavobacterium algicola]MCG9791772.1 T9SS type A sorting domain-containing protein [Flavobacterium algicola]
MKNITVKILAPLLFLLSSILYSQPIAKVTYGWPAVNINNGGSVSFGLSGEIEFSVSNAAVYGNSYLYVHSISVNNSNFVVSSSPYISDNFIFRGETGRFTISKNSTSCSSTSSIVTLVTNVGNFSYTVTSSASSLISVYGGQPFQALPNGQLIPNSSTGTLFGTVDISSSVSRFFAVANSGNCPLNISAINSLTYDPETGVSSPDFTIVPLGISVLNSRYYTLLEVKFSPTSTGTKSARISINSSDLIIPSYTFVVSGEGYNPAVAGPGGGSADFRLWLKADRGINVANGSKVALWQDLGSLGKNASQSVSNNQPTFIDNLTDNLNYNPVVKFENNGTTISQFLGNADNGYYTQETFVVVKPDVAINDGMTIISGTSALAPLFSLISDELSGIGLGNFSNRISGEKIWFNQWSPNSTVIAPYHTIADKTGDFNNVGFINARNTTSSPFPEMELFYNAKDIGTTSSTKGIFKNLGFLDLTFSPNLWKGTPYNIGKNINSGDTKGDLNGRVAEVLSYATRITNGDRPKIETYLALKYGITMGDNGTSKNYVNSSGGVIWDVTANIGFNYNITGIGKDKASDLDQKQSKSSNGINTVTIGLGSVEATNSANINDFSADKNFLIWGSNNGLFTAGSTNTATLRTGLSTAITRIGKKWKIVETGGDVSNVFVSVPLAAFAAMSKSSVEEYVLIVADNSNFGNTDIIDVIPLKLDGKGNLQTWYDFDGTKYFSFGKTEKLVSKSLVSIESGSFLVGEYDLNLNSGSFSIACWIRNNGSGNRTIMGKGVNLELRLNSANKVEGYWDGVLKFVSNTAIPDYKWHHITAVYYSGSANLYIDGVLDVSTFNLTNPTPNYSRFSIGAMYVSKNDVRTPFLGEIDEVSIWDAALTVDQVNFLMNQEVKKGASNMSMGAVLPEAIVKNELGTIQWNSLKAYYDFNSFYGTTVEGLTDDRNFLRINYLRKNKQLTAGQTAPLPYETIADGLWSDESIWKNGSLQVLPNNISIVNNQTTMNGNIVQIKHNVISNGNKTVLALIVEGTDNVTYKTLTASNNSKIEVSHYLKLNGLIDLKERSQLVQTLDSELDNSSIGFIKRDQQGTVNRYNYNYWSSPVGPIGGSNNADFIVKDAFKDGTTSTLQNISWTDSYDGSNSPLTLSRYWLFKFQNTGGYSSWLRFKEDIGTKPSQGFIVKGSGEVDASNTLTQNYTFTGKPFNGPITGSSVLPNSLFLVGNPYPSALDGHEFIKSNISVANGGYNATDIIDGTLYFWQHSPTNDTHVLRGYTGGYATLTLTGATPPVAPIGIFNEGTSSKTPCQYIPVGQGFFVIGSSSLSGETKVKFDNSQRAFVKEDAVDDLFVPISNTMFRTTSQKASNFDNNSNDVKYNDNEVKIHLGFNGSNMEHRQLLIGFMNEAATDGFENGYDGVQIDTKVDDAYFLIENSKFSIQGVGAFDVEKSYPIGVNVQTEGDVHFMIDHSEFLPASQKVYIHDKDLGLYHDITDVSVAVALPVGIYANRFELSFKTNSIIDSGAVLGTPNNNDAKLESSIVVSNNNQKKAITIAKYNDIEITKVIIYNILGQQVLNAVISTNNDSFEIPFTGPQGVYVVKVQTDKGIYNSKIIIQ